MKRFHFPLEIVLRWRSEQAAVEELKLQQLRAAKDRLGTLKAEIRSDLESSRRDLLAQSIFGSDDLENLDSFRRHVHERVRRLENEERQAESNIIAQRSRVVEARRQFELLNRLREKTLDEWSAAANNEQETTAAELFLSRTAARARRRHSCEHAVASGLSNTGNSN